MFSADPAYLRAILTSLRAIPTYNRPWAAPRPAQPITPPPASAWTSGVIATVYATFDGLAGRSDGKVYHRYEPGSEDEFHWSQGCKFAADRLMSGAMFHQAVRGEAKETTK